VKPDWPDDPATVAEARANPDVFAKKKLGMIADHTAEVIGGLEKKPTVLGHSTGGLLCQIIADRGLSAASVAIDPGPFRGVLPLPLSDSLTIDSGWREVCDRAIAFVKRFA
jgi:pimeloyl-ACP methyl ester carboxylesterase